KSRDARPHFDLNGYVAMRLERDGAGQVENLQLCTYGDKQRFFSYRRSCHDNEAGYGRQISAILIE
ncbi:MAG: laccase domain-containing protein, partial [Proteobacteria bacterium]|nr:laccase domain-containing protein [Pseudomonadota bacterium]